MAPINVNYNPFTGCYVFEMNPKFQQVKVASFDELRGQVDQPQKPFSRTPTLDKLEAELEEMRRYGDADDVLQAAARVERERLAKSAPEPMRPALDWNKPTHFDQFPGFTVTSDCASEPLARGLHSPDLKATSHLASPQHGTAHKLG